MTKIMVHLRTTSEEMSGYNKVALKLLADLLARIDFWRGMAHHLGLREPDGPRFDRERAVDYLTGCCMLVHRRVIVAFRRLVRRMETTSARIYQAR